MNKMFLEITKKDIEDFAKALEEVFINLEEKYWITLQEVKTCEYSASIYVITLFVRTSYASSFLFDIKDIEKFIIFGKDKEILRQEVKYRIIKSWDEILFKEREKNESIRYNGKLIRHQAS